MHLLGNDFVIINNVSNNFEINNNMIKHISDRKLGVGCDQVLVLHPPSSDLHDFDYAIYNADGSESGQCGNGALCIAKFIKNQQLLKQKLIKLKTKTTNIDIFKNNNNLYTVNLGKYILEDCFDLKINNNIYKAKKISIGNPHIIIFIENFYNEDIDLLFNSIDINLRQNNNISFIENLNNKIIIKTYERGVGLTLACGSAASSASIACLDEKNLDNNKFEVCFQKGSVYTEVLSTANEVLLSGNPKYVFSGRMIL